MRPPRPAFGARGPSWGPGASARAAPGLAGQELSPSLVLGPTAFQGLTQTRRHSQGIFVLRLKNKTKGYTRELKS